MTIISYSDVRSEIGRSRCHLLLGNGFSIGCDPVFRYESLYETALRAGLSERAQAVFDRLGTNNFEGVLRLLADSEWVARVYGLVGDDPTEIKADIEVVKAALVKAVAESHLPHAGHVPDDRKAVAAEFLKPYHNVFTTNYDLVCYWVNMSVVPPPYQDGFAADHEDPDLPWLVFDGALGEAKGMYYLHGALHLYMVGGEVRKHSYARSARPLTELVREALDQNQYPLFVAEGDPDRKLEQIGKTGYLWYCLEKFGRVKGPLVVYGHGLGGSDQHICNSIADNTELPLVFVGLYGDPDGEHNLLVRASADRMRDRRKVLVDRWGGEELNVMYFESDTAQVWS